MPLYKLSCYCRFFNLDWVQFHSLSSRSAEEVYQYIRTEKELSVSEFEALQNKLEEVIGGLDTETVLYPGHRLYPPGFLYIEKPPVFLLFAGDGELLLKPMISVVGSRRPEERFLIWMDMELKRFLQQSGAGVASGGAIGVDQKATQVALRSGVSSVVILPSGLEQAYPKGIVQLLKGEGVVFLSEYFPHERMQKSHFIRRNRLISSFGAFLLAIQFEVKSGTMITVNYALAQNKEIATLPDHPLASFSSGNLKIIREGAHVIGNGDDLLSLWQSVPNASSSDEPSYLPRQ